EEIGCLARSPAPRTIWPRSRTRAARERSPGAPCSKVGCPCLSSLGAVNTHRDRADVAGAELPDFEQRLAPAVPVDRVAGVGRVATGTAAVGRAAVDGVRERVAEEQLTRVHDVAADVHLDMDVNRAAHVPARIDRVEDREPACGRALDAAHERLADGVVRSLTRV